MKLLIVEDEVKIANSIKEGLEQENYAVDVSYDGTEGLDFALTEEYDLMILDRMLPDIEGVEIIKHVRNAQIHTPILLLTAKGQVSDRVEGLDSGADDYMVKPFSFIELLARIRALTRRPKQHLGDVLVCGNISLDSKRFEVMRENKQVMLSRKEFALLEYLMRHKGQILKKEQIVSHVWDYNSDVLPNSVEVYIKHIREKLGKPNVIKTVRGFGYKLGERHV